MTEVQDVRWIQRFRQYELAFKNLKDAVILSKQRPLSNLEEQGLIKAFELVHELAWLTIKDFYEAQGETGIQGSKDAFRLAFKRGLIENGEVFMKSIRSRQLSVHTYNEKTATQIHSDIASLYMDAFEDLLSKFRQILEQE